MPDGYILYNETMLQNIIVPSNKSQHRSLSHVQNSLWMIFGNRQSF